MTILDGKRILITGGTGSLGKVLTRRILSGEQGTPEKVVIMSRDEAKQHQMRLDFTSRSAVTDEVVYENFLRMLQFRIGDVRDIDSVAGALRDIDIVINAAALKQVPTCEYFPLEAVRTNIMGAGNIVTAIVNYGLPVKTIVGVSTDKAALPVNVMGMTKALQERIFVGGQIALPKTRAVLVRYGNVIASRGSVVPLFRRQIAEGGPLTITDTRMTRFLLSLSDAVDTIFAAIKDGRRGETWVPRIPAARIVDVARAMIGDRAIEQTVTGIRPGEKLHEVLVSPEESVRTVQRGNYYAIRPMLPELTEGEALSPDVWDFSSGTDPIPYEDVVALLKAKGVLDTDFVEDGEYLV